MKLKVLSPSNVTGPRRASDNITVDIYLYSFYFKAIFGRESIHSIRHDSGINLELNSRIYIWKLFGYLLHYTLYGIATWALSANYS